MLNENVELISFNRVAKCIQQVEFNNVEHCWMEMMNQHHLTVRMAKHIQHVEFNNVERF